MEEEHRLKFTFTLKLLEQTAKRFTQGRPVRIYVSAISLANSERASDNQSGGIKLIAGGNSLDGLDDSFVDYKFIEWMNDNCGKVQDSAEASSNEIERRSYRGSVFSIDASSQSFEFYSVIRLFDAFHFLFFFFILVYRGFKITLSISPLLARS